MVQFFFVLLTIRRIWAFSGNFKKKSETIFATHTCTHFTHSCIQLISHPKTLSDSLSKPTEKTVTSEIENQNENRRN